MSKTNTGAQFFANPLVLITLSIVDLTLINVSKLTYTYSFIYNKFNREFNNLRQIAINIVTIKIICFRENVVIYLTIAQTHPDFQEKPSWYTTITYNRKIGDILHKYDINITPRTSNVLAKVKQHNKTKIDANKKCMLINSLVVPVQKHKSVKPSKAKK